MGIKFLKQTHHQSFHLPRHSDVEAVRALYDHLTADWVDAWLDKEKLLPGQDWELEIRKAVRSAAQWGRSVSIDG